MKRLRTGAPRLRLLGGALRKLLISRKVTDEFILTFRASGGALPGESSPMW